MSWDNLFDELQEYTKENGRLPNGYDKKCNQLVKWIKKNRAMYNNKTLNKEHIDKLNKLPLWKWNYNDEVWTSNIISLKQYVQKHNMLPPFQKKHPEQHIRHLILWIGNIRTQYKKGNLTKTQIDTLEDIDTWSWNCKQDKWRLNYLKLKNVIAENKQFPSKNEQKTLRLAQWIFINRQHHKHGELEQRKVDMLNKLPYWHWTCRHSWNELYVELKNYTDKYKIIPNKQINQSLANWVNINRNLYNNNALSQDKIDNLNKINGWVWSDRMHKWQINYNEVKQFYDTHDRLPSTQDNLPKLLTWITNNKSNYKKQKLSADKIKLIKLIL